MCRHLCRAKTDFTVVTEGVEGNGKYFFVQKFILDWAEEKENQDVDFVFRPSVKELNLITGEKSLHKLLTLFHSTLSDLKDSVETNISNISLGVHFVLAG